MSDHIHEPYEFDPTSLMSTPTPAMKKRAREHMVKQHAASESWATFTSFEIVFELHNNEHGRDAQGLPMLT